jgi:hypothetical protein
VRWFASINLDFGLAVHAGGELASLSVSLSGEVEGTHCKSQSLSNFKFGSRLLSTTSAALVSEAFRQLRGVDLACDLS